MNDLTNFIEEELGALLRSAREDQGLTRKQVAEKLGVTEEDILRIEKHAGKVTLGMLQKYADLLGKKVQLKFL
ncbi:MAG: helix-turn-helix domain-containing protein [bacterium]